MNKQNRLLLALSVASVLVTGSVQAGVLDSLSSAIGGLTKPGSSNTTSTANSANTLSLSTLTDLLNGGDSALSAKTMGNAAGILEYCVKNNILSQSGTDLVKNQLLDKLGLNTPASANNQDYQQGLAGLLNTNNGQQVDLASLDMSKITEQVKHKACELVLDQGKSFLF
ncbi:DUF2501 domain-containing protein [Serratia microhaemolytica]|uniref:DUF2501 domain-containing protein n=1 Tax=Serratia microhaemolytica TaxID=2675110 RepID=UPI000FDF3436|nr:DUF2501 domain-containing protein [Serratia microhaemolytica]